MHRDRIPARPCIVGLVCVALLQTARAEVRITDTGYTEEKRGEDVFVTRRFTLDTGAKTFALESNGVAIGYVNGSWHSGELCTVEVSGEPFFAFNAGDGRKEDFRERIAFETAKNADSVTLTAAQEGVRARVTLVLTARDADDKLELTVKIDPKQMLWHTLIGFECYPGATGPRHKLNRAIATARRTELLEPWEGAKRIDLAPDEPWVFLYDNFLDLGVAVQGDQKAHGGCGLCYVPDDSAQAWISLGTAHINPAFRYGANRTEMHFALLDFGNEKSNADALAHMKALGATGYLPGGGRAPQTAPGKGRAQVPVETGVAPPPPAAAQNVAARPEPAPIPPAPPSALLPGGALRLVSNGETLYVIHHVRAAPVSVKDAARELQRVIAASTGVTIPIRDEPASPMICLGDSPATGEAGLSGKALPYETYRIQTVGGNLYIVGRDTPTGKRTAFSGISRGTQFGVYTFLEDVVGVRWIMPGHIGEEIPRYATLTVPPLNVRDGPAFEHRSLGIDDPPLVKGWALRQKISTGAAYANMACSFVVKTPHYWAEFLPEELREAHPDWDAVDGEVNKFCTRQPGAVRAFARNAVLWLDQHSDWHMASASPSDGQQFCRCERCTAFIREDAHGQDSVTLNILDFYNDVARAVRHARPGRMVGGYAYGRYTYPPEKPVRLEPNLFIEWTALNYYGQGLYKSGYRDEFERVAAAWRALTPNVGYHNYCHWHRSESGAPYAAALPILKMQFPVLKRLGYRSIREYGTSNWGYGGPNNYLLAKLKWDADADVDALYREWLDIAYGAGADAMTRIYALLDDAFREFKTTQESFAYHGDNYEISGDKIAAIHVPRLDRIEALYREALDATKNERPRMRVAMFGQNMVVFHYNLRKAGYLPHPETSLFYRSDAAYDAFIHRAADDREDVPGWFRAHLRRSRPMRPKAGPAGCELERRTLAIPRRPAGTPIAVDGRIGIAEWQAAAVVGEFRLPGGLDPAQAQTVVRLAYDATALYLGVECSEDRMDEMKAKALPHDSMRIYAGNTVEVFLNFTDGHERFWHLTVNPANSRWDGIGAQESEDPAWDSAAVKADGKWTVEMTMPFSSLGIGDPAGRSCRANLARARAVGRTREHSTWNAVGKGFLEPWNFGTFTFAEK